MKVDGFVELFKILVILRIVLLKLSFMLLKLNTSLCKLLSELFNIERCHAEVTVYRAVHRVSGGWSR